MKKNVILISLSFLLLMVTFSCKKDFSNNNNDGKQNYLRADNNNFVQIPISKFQYIDRNGEPQEMLVFESSDDYFVQLNRLEILDEQHEQEFLDRHPNATVEELNVLDSIENFNEYQVYIDFDNNLNFNGLIFNYINSENQWLDKENLQDALDPDNIYFGLEESQLAVLNQDFAYMIKKNKGDIKIIKHFPDGIVVINDGNINTLNQISSYNNYSDINFDGMDNIEGFGNTDSLSDDCKEAKTIWKYINIPNENDYKIKFISKVKQNHLTTKFKWKLKAKSYKKRGRRWRRKRVKRLEVRYSQKSNAIGCGNIKLFFDPSRYYEYKNNRSKVKKVLFLQDFLDVEYPSVGNVNEIYFKDNELFGEVWCKIKSNSNFIKIADVDAYDGSTN